MSNSGFPAPWWLPGPHLQTVWGRITRRAAALAMRREILETPDGDELVLDHVDGPDASLLNNGAPVRVVLLHGLEGSSFSPYVQGFLSLIAARGWNATVLNFRSCARDLSDRARMLPNRRPRLYHSGETTDFDFVSGVLAAREPQTRLAAIGVSLGGNALLKWLGEHSGQTRLAAAASVSVPYDLAAGSRHLERGLGPFYVENFLTTLRRKALDTARRFPEAAERIEQRRVQCSRTFWDFDDAATAPLHGFAGAADYYARSSSLGFVGRITTPTLCLSAEDDPFLPAAVLARMREAASPAVEPVFTGSGGHMGFVAGPAPWRFRYWAEEYVVEWLSRRLE